MTTEIVKPEYEQLRDEIRAAIQGSSASQTAVAAEAGVGASALSQFLNASYKGDSHKIAMAMRNWLELIESRKEMGQDMPSAKDWCPTPTANIILGTLHYAHTTGDIAVIYGGAGLGKTMTCKHYAGKRNNVWIATMTPSTRSVSGCLERVALTIGLQGPSGSPSRLELAIMEKLARTGGLLIIDEAQHLNVRGLETLRSLHDATGCGLALVGNDLVYAQLTGRGTKSAAFAQLFSRIGKRAKLTNVTRIDVKSLCAAWGITENKVVDYAMDKIAKQQGALRGLTKALRLAATTARDHNESITLAHLQAAWIDLTGVGGGR